MKDLFSLAGKVAMVTGASAGIGREIALGYAHSGADIIAVAQNEERLNSLKAEVEGLGKRCMIFRANLVSTEKIQELVDTAVAKMGRIDILANVAGVNVHKPAEEMTEEEWDFVYNVNIRTLFFLCQSVGKVMLENGYGKIVNISSTFGFVGFAGRSAYGSTKAAVTNLTKTLALEWSSRGINVNGIAPGPVRTPAREELFSKPEFFNNLIAKVPIKRVADPIDIVGPAIFLASQAASFVTGETLLVDGGYCAQ